MVVYFSETVKGHRLFFFIRDLPHSGGLDEWGAFPGVRLQRQLSVPQNPFVTRDAKV
jgi:hypothetical protein